MRRLAFLLRPGWLILAAVVAGFAYMCFTVLAPWQLGKNDATSERNQLIEDSVDAAPVAVTDLLDGDREAATEWRKVYAEGSYVPDSTVLVRLRHLDGAPAYGVLSAFTLTDGRMLLVDRGLVAAVDGSQPPPIEPAPTGTQRVEARVRVSENIDPERAPAVQNGIPHVYSIDVPQETTVLGLPLTPVPVGERGAYLQLADDQPGAFTPVPLPQLDSGPYLSYGLQWLAFGIMAPLGLGYFAWAEIRERRKSRVSAPPEPAAPESEPVTKEARLADRYGRTPR
ncbi:SURF1 family protein [Nocardia flavorosea]|uniref:SURF1-like protein n=1 Tax=Nocardia flavorosea TaxID=53429 RepID=A0A846YE74_9NOCA|nr:SURF1 family cytochrome oxidase biogenesis protein [Nocardia flavorosea]NKY57313.1 SURF1 family protein [Nocardia flavorosea]